jgi:two-component system CheB/CheR fusion protein
VKDTFQNPSHRNKKSSRTHTATEEFFPIVGIGASAGGLDAFSRLLANLPGNTGMAYIFIQHLSRSHNSLLTELLSKATPMTVTEVREGTRVEPDHVYVIPPNTGLTISRRALHLHRRPPPPALAWPIDDFFHSLANDAGVQAIGVVLSGNASDGATGLKAIQEVGGITFAQNVASAKYGEMPKNAIDAGGADKILRPSQIGRELARIGSHSYVRRMTEKTEEERSLRDSDLQLIFGLLQETAHIDFRHYRQTTLRRRIRRRMLLRKIDSSRDYVEHIRRDPAERLALSQDLLIHTTSFFRDPKTFQALEKTVFPRLTRQRSPKLPLRIWVPGCSTGQEAYSIMIVLAEFQARHRRHFPVRLFASDIEAAAVQKARKGIYRPNELIGVSTQRLRRFFTQVPGGYQIAKSLREQCVFARQDIVHDPPYSNVSLISCRNVLIYLEPESQKRILSLFHYALEKDGALVLGPAETPTPFFRSFSKVNKEYRIYTKVPHAVRSHSKWTYSRKSAPWPSDSSLSGVVQPRSHTVEDIARVLASIELAIKNTPAVKGAKRIREKTRWQQEMIDTLTHFQTIVEDQERSAEEIQSNNEELQSTNEELETAKEELQSSNEEISTVSEELQIRNTELTQTNDDLNNLLTSVQLPLVMVGNDLQIRRVTRQARFSVFLHRI